MAYTALRFDVASASADAWSDALLQGGALSADIADPHSETADETPLYGEPDPSGIGQADVPLEYWALSRITALFAEDFTNEDLRHLLESLAAELDEAVPLFETYPVAERDWVRETQAQFNAIPITDNFWIVPTWVTPPASAQHILRLDPGLAFGTGSHPTTRLCLRWLAEHQPRNQAVLDYGCGSGILLLAARLLGANAADAFGTDIDPQALIASAENARLNQIDAQFVSSADLPAGKTFDLTIANILANPLRMLAPLLAGRTKAGGRIILSGILASQRQEMCERYQEWFAIDGWQEEDGWVLLAGIRRNVVASTFISSEKPNSSS